MPVRFRPARGLGRREPDAGAKAGRGTQRASAGQAPAWRPQPRAAHLRAHSHSSSACASTLAVSALRPSCRPEGRGTRQGMRGLGGLAGVRRSGQTRQAPASGLRAARIIRHFSGGEVRWERDLSGGRRRRREEGRAPARDHRAGAFLRAPGECAWRVAP